MRKWAVIIILAIALLGFVQTSNATPLIYEGELITVWAGNGSDDTPYQAKVNVDYDLQRCQQRGSEDPPDGTLRVYFKSTSSVLIQMISDSVNILWNGEYVEDLGL